MRGHIRRLLKKRSAGDKLTKLTSLGFSMPSDFPDDAHQKVHSCLVKYKEIHPAEWISHGLGWNGIAYRYRAMAEYDEDFTASVLGSASPAPEERYRQGKALFGFFMNALSVVECFFYSANCMASILKPEMFPLSTPKDLRISLETVARRFASEFPNDRLSKEMKRCLEDAVYKKMKDMRDVLAHRGAPPRRFYRGGNRDGLATMPDNIKSPSAQWQFDLLVDERSTTSCREWLSLTLRGLTEATEAFCNQRL